MEELPPWQGSVFTVFIIEYPYANRKKKLRKHKKFTI